MTTPLNPPIEAKFGSANRSVKFRTFEEVKAWATRGEGVLGRRDSRNSQNGVDYLEHVLP